MKNLLIYTGPNKKFSDEDETLARIQIDNSLDLGWKKEDIILATDFPYEYNGIKSTIVSNRLYYDFDLTANKPLVISHLLEQRLINSNTLYWCHDFDAFELNKINETDLDLKSYDLGLVHYFYKPEWSCTNYYFKKGAYDLFNLINKTIANKPWRSRNDEKAITWLVKHNRIEPNRLKKLNTTYNIAKRCLTTVYNEAEKPIKVLHFRPSDKKDAMMSDTALNMFMYGKNRLKKRLMNERLIHIFNNHGIK